MGSLILPCTLEDARNAIFGPFGSEKGDFSFSSRNTVLEPSKKTLNIKFDKLDGIDSLETYLKPC